jgi:hypothetical protein
MFINDYLQAFLMQVIDKKEYNSILNKQKPIFFIAVLSIFLMLVSGFIAAFLERNSLAPIFFFLAVFFLLLAIPFIFLGLKGSFAMNDSIMVDGGKILIPSRLVRSDMEQGFVPPRNSINRKSDRLDMELCLSISNIESIEKVSVNRRYDFFDPSISLAGNCKIATLIKFKSSIQKVSRSGFIGLLDGALTNGSAYNSLSEVYIPADDFDKLKKLVLNESNSLIK